MSIPSSYMDDAERLPSSFSVVHGDSERRVYLYRDSDGQLWESDPGDSSGTLHPVDDHHTYLFHSERHASPTTPPASSTTAPMTHFPDTWDPPANFELEDLPSRQRIATKIGNYRRTVFGNLSRTSSASSETSKKSSQKVSVPETRSSGERSSVGSSLSSVTGSISGLWKRSSRSSTT